MAFCIDIGATAFCFLVFIGLVAGMNDEYDGTLWNSTSDPMPPVQPKWIGYSSISYANYTFIDGASGGTFNLVNIPGWFFEDYSTLRTQTWSAGNDQGIPRMTFSSNNFNNPTDPHSNLYAPYSEGECSWSETEGGGGYSGYDFMQKTIVSLASAGLPVYFKEEEYLDWGPCLVYTALMPDAPDSALLRDMKYIIKFQKSSGLMVSRNNVGIEWCCADQGTCVSGTNTKCKDGTDARKTWAISQDSYSNHQIYTADAFAQSNIFRQDCPFDSPSPPSAGTSGDGPAAGYKGAVPLSIGVFTAGMVVGAMMFYKYAQDQKKKESLASQDGNKTGIQTQNKSIGDRSL